MILRDKTVLNKTYWVSQLGKNKAIKTLRVKVSKSMRTVIFNVKRFLLRKLFKKDPKLFHSDLYPNESILLMDEFIRSKPAVYLEIGVFWGGTFKQILELRDMLGLSTSCVGIDVWDEVKVRRSNTHISGWPNREIVDLGLKRKGFDKYKLLAGSSSDLTKLVDRGIDLVFHDADHTYEAVKEDMENLSLLMKKGAKLLIHNMGRNGKPDRKYVASDGGPYKAVQEQIETGKWRMLDQQSRMALLERV